MRIGVVSDTHNNVKNTRRIVELFNEAAVERVIHTGDITQPKTLALFAQLEAPLVGVFGNNDAGERSALVEAAREHGFHFVDPPLTLTWHARRLVIVHDPLEFDSVPLDPEDRPYDIALHGHTHRQRIEYDGQQLTFNPGECAGHMPGRNAIGIIELATLTPSILNF